MNFQVSKPIDTAKSCCAAGVAGRLLQVFKVSAGGILLFTGAAKILSGLGKASFLNVSDPLFNIQFRNLFILVGLIEIIIAMVCFCSSRQLLALKLVAWLATSFLIYRIGLSWIGWHRPCSCLGNLTDALHISPQLADNAMKAVLIFLFIGSYGTLVLFRMQKRRDILTSSNPEGSASTA
jgi:hypothetical protein